MELCYRRLDKFVEHAWPIVEKKRKFINNWHIGCICEHLEAVTYGQITRLVINMPPRHMKSLNCSVLWPAWHWLRLPYWQWLFAAYAQNLTIRDNVKCRRVMSSAFYEEMQRRAVAHDPVTFDEGPIVLVGDQNTKTRYDNNYTGYRIATSVDGALTGEGGDTIVIDDANNVREAESDAVRNGTNEWFDEAMQSRLNGTHGSIVVIQQRTNENDLTGHIKEKYKDYDFLILPARYEGKKIISTSLAYEDPREEIDEPLWPERYDHIALGVLEVALGDYAAAGQLQQRPAPREGGMFKPEKIEIVTVPPDALEETVRYWDKAGTDKKKNPGSACTAGGKIARMRGGKWIILDMVRGQWNAARRNEIIKQTAVMDSTGVDIWVEQEPGSGGLESAELTIRDLAGWKVFADRPTGEKAVRAEPFACQVNAGNVCMMKGDWNSVLIEEMRNFPNSRRKDQVDCLAGGFNKISLVKKKKGGTW